MRADLWLALAVACACAVPAAADAAFPGTDPTESPRINAPNDPDFDRCENDNEGGPECQSYFNEEFRAFGFSPDSAQFPTGIGSPATYADCNPLTPGGDGQLDGDGEDANEAAEGATGAAERCNQIAGVRVDTAWKYFDPESAGDLPGREDVSIAILDTGARWQSPRPEEQDRAERATSCRSRRTTSAAARSRPGARPAAPSSTSTTPTATAPSTSATTAATRASTSTAATRSPTGSSTPPT